MNAFRTISRVLVVSAVILVNNANAVIDFAHKAGNLLQKHPVLIGSTLIGNKLFDKNEHFKKALYQTSAMAIDRKLGKADNCDVNMLVQHLAINYAIRKGEDFLHSQGITTKIVTKRLDVLPGMVRDAANTVIEGIAEVATEPEVLTLLALNYVMPIVIGSFSNK